MKLICFLLPTFLNCYELISGDVTLSIILVQVQFPGLQSLQAYFHFRDFLLYGGYFLIDIYFYFCYAIYKNGCHLVDYFENLPL